MKFHIITLMPEIFSILSTSKIFERSANKGIFSYNTINPRDFTDDIHKTIDDKPFGGGHGMILKYEPLKQAFLSINKGQRHLNICFSPRGKVLDQRLLQDLVENYDDFTLLCGRYQGIDQRVIDSFVDMELSVGDFILTNGDFAAVLFIDAMSRLANGTLGNENSLVNESFASHRLEHDWYTKPREIDGLKVPEPLLNGNHTEISQWKNLNSLEKTIKKRPDLLTTSPLTDKELKILKKSKT